MLLLGEKRQRKVRGKQLLKKTNAVYRPSDDEDEPVSKRKPDRSIAREKDDADENYYQRRLRCAFTFSHCLQQLQS